MRTSEFPQTPNDTRAAWLTEFSAVSSEIGAISEEGAGRTMDSSRVARRVSLV